LSAASHWLDGYWAETYPRVDEDFIARRSALNCWADPMAVIDGLRKTTLVASRQHGRFALRQIDMAAGLIPASETETKPSEAQINAAFAELPTEHLQNLRQNLAVALAAVKAITEKMSGEAGPDAAPEFNPLTQVLGRIARVLDTQLEMRADKTGSESAVTTGVASGTMAVGTIGSRQDAIRALDAIAEFFRRNEPSSPVPMFCERAKRLVAKNFLEVGQARLAGGLRDSD
jgi:type VI secretion system protein ImpA